MHFCNLLHIISQGVFYYFELKIIHHPQKHHDKNISDHKKGYLQIGLILQYEINIIGELA